MKKFAVVITLALVGVFFAGNDTLNAASCANVSSFGAVTLTLPKIPDTSNRALWVRMQGSADSKLLIEIDESQCISLESQDLRSDVWSWQTPRQGTAVLPVSFTKSSGNAVKIIGVDSGVKIDRVLITELSCVPQDFGNNCQNSVSLEQATQNGVKTLAPLPDLVQGKIIISETPYNYSDSLSGLSYTVNGRVLQKFSGPEPFDTTLLPNGKYTVYITTELDDGDLVKESIVIDINNSENILSPVVRWAKLNRQPLLVAVLVVMVLTLGLLAAKLYKRSTKKRRERKFQGL